MLYQILNVPHVSCAQPQRTADRPKSRGWYVPFVPFVRHIHQHPPLAPATPTHLPSAHPMPAPSDNKRASLRAKRVLQRDAVRSKLERRRRRATSREAARIYLDDVTSRLADTLDALTATQCQLRATERQHRAAQEELQATLEKEKTLGASLQAELEETKDQAEHAKAAWRRVSGQAAYDRRLADTIATNLRADLEEARARAERAEGVAADAARVLERLRAHQNLPWFRRWRPRVLPACFA